MFLPLSPKTTVPGGARSTAGAGVCHLFSKLLLEINKFVDDLAGRVTETPPETWTPAFLGRFVSSTGSPCWAVRLSRLTDALRTAGAAPDENHFCFPQLLFFFFFFLLEIQRLGKLLLLKRGLNFEISSDFKVFRHFF